MHYIFKLKQCVDQKPDPLFLLGVCFDCVDRFKRLFRRFLALYLIPSPWFATTFAIVNCIMFPKSLLIGL
jgi:hypothetical protein